MTIHKMIAGRLYAITTTTCPTCYGEGGDSEQRGSEVIYHTCRTCDGLGTIQHRREVRDDS